jgi:glutamate synthase domain-containing protein 2
MHVFLIVIAVIVVLLVVVAIYDVMQRRHAILRNFPLLGHFRYLLEAIGPELRQYIIANNETERPFSRNQRRWIYASSKQQNNYYGFGTDQDLEHTSNQILIRHVPFPVSEPAPGQIGAGPEYSVPSAKLVGATHGRAKPHRPASVVNISGMSFGALGANAVEALNRGSALANCLQNTGEGGLTTYHQHGGELVFQIGTGYFGVRDTQGRFSLPHLQELCAANPVRMIEIKISQGAKPGHGGVLPGVKVTPEIARFRGVEPGVDCISPPGHSEFHDADSMIEFVERIADATGLPVGVKSAVGAIDFWELLARRMKELGAGPDFLTIDGGEGGTGAAPLVFADHVSMPFKIGMSRVYTAFAREGMHERIAFAGSARLGFPEEALLAFGLGCDWINVGREAMLSIGCIQAQRCHTNACPTGVASQKQWLQRGLDPQLKSVRMANYVMTMRKELLELSRTCGQKHPALIDPASIEIVDEHFHSVPALERFGYEPGWGVPAPEDIAQLHELLGEPQQPAEAGGNVHTAPQQMAAAQDSPHARAARGDA